MWWSQYFEIQAKLLWKLATLQNNRWIAFDLSFLSVDWHLLASFLLDAADGLIPLYLIFDAQRTDNALVADPKNYSGYGNVRTGKLLERVTGVWGHSSSEKCTNLAYYCNALLWAVGQRNCPVSSFWGIHVLPAIECYGSATAGQGLATLDLYWNEQLQDYWSLASEQSKAEVRIQTAT